MTKYLLLFAILGLLYWSWRKRRNQVPDRDSPVAKVPDRMVCCDQCGVYLPESDSVRLGDAYFCNAAHRDAKQRSTR